MKQLTNKDYKKILKFYKKKSPKITKKNKKSSEENIRKQIL